MIWTIFFAAGLSLSAATTCQSVATDRVRAGDLAAAVPSFASVDAGRDIGPAPLAGARRVLRSSEIERIARTFGVTLEAAPPEVCVERATLQLTAELLLPVLQQAMADKAAKIEILDFSRYSIPLGSLEFPRSGLAASGMWRGRVLLGENRSSPVWARVRITNPESGEALQLSLPPVPRAPAVPKEIERGDGVRVEVTSGNVVLAFQGSAESAGMSGELIIVKSLESGRRFQARVESKGKASIHK